MILNRVGRATVVLLAAVMSGLLAAPGPKIVRRGVTPEESVKAADYWTPERRASAIPIDVRADESLMAEVDELVASAQVIRPSVAPKAGAHGLPRPAAEDYWTAEQSEDVSANSTEPLANGYTRFKVPNALYKGAGSQFPYIAIGRLFGRFDGVSYSCSAAVVANQLVLTSRQCIYETAHSEWAANVQFYPAYQNGLNPDLAGGWSARQLLTFDTGSQRYNIGIVQLYNYQRNGCRAKAGSPQIVSFTGYLGTKYGGSYANRQFNVFGYPAVEIPGPPTEGFNGKFMFSCQSNTKALNQGGISETVETGCDLTAGSNGGPWIEQFVPDGAGANNFVGSLTSHRLTGRSERLEGPQFRADNFNALLQAGLQEGCP